MSEYSVIELDMNDGECIKESLKELGYIFEDHDTAQNLVGFQGDSRTQVANIIVRRKHVGAASNDIGFLKKEDGNYELIISDYDKRTTGGKKILKDLKQIYGKHKFLKQAKKMGFSVKSTKVDEKGRIKIRVMGR